jgi:hypothetical protein
VIDGLELAAKVVDFEKVALSYTLDGVVPLKTNLAKRHLINMARRRSYFLVPQRAEDVESDSRLAGAAEA